MSSASVRQEVTCTYRVQLHSGFTFADLAARLSNIAELGVSHLYLSPIQQAMPGSTHGYDWVPPPSVSTELGGIDGLRDLRCAAAAHGLGIIVDIVPNHTGIQDAALNSWWWDVLTHGVDSPYAHYFDIDFATDNGADGKIALPVLGSEEDAASLRIEDGELRYYCHRFPLAPGSRSGDTDPTSVHARQHYRLVPWRSGAVSYRRFFSVNGLAGLRQEDSAVYDATHTVVRDLVTEDLIDGIRVDHPDGLARPVDYLRRLRSDIGPDRVLLIEKILTGDEQLDPDLPVDGTTGYDQLRSISEILLDPAGLDALTRLHSEISSNSGAAEWLAVTGRELKRTVLQTTFPSELGRLRRSVVAALPSPPGVTDAEIDAALVEIVAATPVYRADYHVLGALLDRTIDDVASDYAGAEAVRAAVESGGEPSWRLAQLSGAVMAKSIEDCLFYRTARLVSTQEVGSEPAEPSMSLTDFHEHNARRARLWPRAMTALSTHDTKRSEDVRARISLLSEIPDRWASWVIASEQRVPAPDAVLGLFLRQNLFGIWPVASARGSQPQLDSQLRTRFHEYATKAMREGGVGTSWVAVDDGFESSVHRWIDDLLDGPDADELSTITDDLTSAWHAQCLVQKALSMLTPGFPDIYQGTQWWTDSLADPDNRREVDYSATQAHPKYQLVKAIATLRRERPELFGPQQRYQPHFARGAGAEHVIAFSYGSTEHADVVVLALRWTLSLTDTDCAATTFELPPGNWQDILCGATLSAATDVATLFAQLPVVVLVRT